MTKIQVPSETVVFEVSEGGVRILDSQMSMTGMDDKTPAVCDLCSAPLGAMKDVKHIVSPETVSIAVRNGYRPDAITKRTKDDLCLFEKDQGLIEIIMEKTLASWIEMVNTSETPWALCDDCYEAVTRYKENKP